MKQLEVQIMGQNYLLGCPDNSEALLFEAVGKVDAAMCKIRDAGKVKARDRIAVLASLNLAFQLLEQAPTAVPASTSATSELGCEPANAQLEALLNRLDAALANEAPNR